MKATFIGHASILLEANGVTVLSDPWWRGPCFGAQWWNYPLPFLSPIEEQRIDYIYISHGHHDHLHPGTLATLPKTAKVLVSSMLDLSAGIREIGFEVIEIPPDRAVRIGDENINVRIMPTHGNDTLMVLSDGHEVCLNLNDALHSAPGSVQKSLIRKLKTLYRKIDYVFCGYGVASHFPNCYRIPHKNNVATARQRQAYFNRQWARIIADLEPKYGFPFAADVVFLQNELFWANEATHNSERPTSVFQQLYPNSQTQVIDIAPGFQFADGQLLRLVEREPLQADRIREELKEQIYRANRVGREPDSSIQEIIQLFKPNLSNCREYLSTFSGDYRIAIQFLNFSTGLILQKHKTELLLQPVTSNQMVGAELVYTTRLAYLRWALQRPYGDEILFVGSGGIFEYPSKEAASQNIHQELIRLIRNQPIPPRSAAINPRGINYMIKQHVKKLLGRSHRDLYNLQEWTVFD